MTVPLVSTRRIFLNPYFVFNCEIFHSLLLLTQVVEPVAGGVECAGEELETDDGENCDGKHEEEGDVGQRADGLDDGADHHLQA